MNDVLTVKRGVTLQGFFNRDLVLEEGAEFKPAKIQDVVTAGECRKTILVQRLFPTGLDPTRIEVPLSIFE